MVGGRDFGCKDTVARLRFTNDLEYFFLQDVEGVGLAEVVDVGFSRRYSCYSVTVENGCFDRFDVDMLNVDMF